MCFSFKFSVLLCWFLCSVAHYICLLSNLSMWKLLLAAVAGCTCFAAKHLFSTKRHPLLVATLPEDVPQCRKDNAVSRSPHGSTTRPKNAMKKMGRRGSKSGVRISKVEVRPAVEIRPHHRKGRKRLPFIAVKPGFCSCKDSSLIDWGVCFGVMCMMAGKAEFTELSNTMNETAKNVEELKSELSRRKSPCAHQIMDSGGNIGMEYCKMSGRNDEIIMKKTNNELRRDNGVKFCGHAVSDGGECGSSALTEEPNLRVMEMDQLEAELEFELRKLQGSSAIDTPCHEFVFDQETPLHHEVLNEGCNGIDNWNFNSSQSHGILASELNQKLSHLLIEQQEQQIVELESELYLAQSKLHQKEAELQALKDCVKCLTELPLSTDSDDETEALKSRAPIIGL